MDRNRLSITPDKYILAPASKSPSLLDPSDAWSRRMTRTPPAFRPNERRIPSPYETAQSNRQHKKIYPNRVYTPWYRRYVRKLPEVESIDFQPFDEVQKVDEEIALQYFYGEDVQLTDPASDRHANEKRKSALQRYRRVKEQEEKERLNAATAEMNRMGAGAKMRRFPDNAKQMISTMETEFGATLVEKKVYSPIVEFLLKLHIKKQRQLRKVILKRHSKWRTAKSPAILLKIRAMYKRLLQDEIHARFRKVIRLVVAVIRFIETIRFISGDTKKILREIENFMVSQTKDTQKSNLYSMRKKVFDAHKYNISKELHIPFDTKMTLTKPWFTRHNAEIDMVVQALQSYKSFVQYPPMFQRRLATLAWYIEAQADKYIIRERHIACDFYVLLTGKAKVVKMRGSPYIYHNGELVFIRYIKKSEGFGDESMSDPECERDYSVISTEPCALLAISVHDYLQMLSTRKEDEFAPEHIIFLCNLTLMDNFPKVKLLEEGNENITIHYFRPETVVSKNLEASNFVFVVFSGSCQLLAEVFPDIIGTPKKEHFVAKPTRRMTMKKCSIKFEQSFMKMLADRRKTSTSMPRTNWVKQLFESQRKALEPMLVATGVSMKDYYDKTQQILQTLPRQQRNAICAAGLPRLSSSKHQSARTSETMYTREEFTQPYTQALGSYYKHVKSATSVAAIVDNARVPTPRSSVCAERRESSGVKMDSKMVSLSELTETSLNSEMVLPQDSLFSGLCRSDREDSIPQVVEESPKLEILKKSEVTEKRGHIHLYSRWKQVRTLSRGDYAGHEWLDYRDGPYEPPEEIMSLRKQGRDIEAVDSGNMSGIVGNLSDKQAAALAELRDSLQDLLKPHHDDYFLLRFLRARNFDLNKSEAMLRNHIRWRQQHHVDSILQDFEPPEVMRKYYTGGLFGQDKEGSLLWIEPQGYLDIKGILMSMKKQDVIRSKVWLVETIYRQFEILTREQGRRVEQIVIIFDLEKFGMKHLWKPGMDVFIEIISMFEDQYPETLKKTYVINAPRIFPVVYNILRPFLSEATHKKVSVIGSNYKETLLQHIEPDQLPKHWGGSCVDPDGNPRCPSKIVPGGDVPVSYYRQNDLADLTGFTEISIGRGSSLQLDFVIDKANSALRWQFQTNGFDIGFGVFRRTTDQRQKACDMEPILPTHRVNSHMVPEDGTICCKMGGIYVIRFDNTYSYMRSKKLHYLIEVLEQTCELEMPKSESNATFVSSDDVYESYS